jgi:lipoprotein NlpD
VTVTAPAAPSVVQPAVKPVERRAEQYVVKPGDTLYSIALEQGLDYRELAGWNDLESANVIRQGQVLRLTAPPGGVVAAPLRTPGGVESRPLGTPAPPAVAGDIKSEPKGVRVPYSDQAYAELAKPDAAPARPEVKPEPKPEAKSDSAKGGEDPDWGWPATGKIIATFNGNTSKGIDIAGKSGQAVIASAAGRVIFSGTGIRGMGKFIVIKHNPTFISVYAHNNEVLVKYDQNVTKGQKIAEMGNTDADQVKLHFEIRRLGNPVDPLKFLPDAAR